MFVVSLLCFICTACMFASGCGPKANAQPKADVSMCDTMQSMYQTKDSMPVDGFCYFPPDGLRQFIKDAIPARECSTIYNKNWQPLYVVVYYAKAYSVYLYDNEEDPAYTSTRVADIREWVYKHLLVYGDFSDPPAANNRK